jgi:hypothetical protein
LGREPLDCKARIDRFPQRTLEWLSLPVLADPFWGRPALAAETPWRKTQQAEEVQPAAGCARVRTVAFDADFDDLFLDDLFLDDLFLDDLFLDDLFLDDLFLDDLVTEADVCTR